MKKTIIALTLVLAMCLSLAACGSSAQSNAPQSTAPVETPEFAYVASFDTFAKGSKTYINPRLQVADGYIAYSWEKVGENIPEGVTPEYQGQYDVYAAVLYLIGNDGSVKKLPNYAPMDLPENTEGYKNYTANSNMDSLIADKDGTIVTVDAIYASWFDGPENIALYSDEYWENMHYEQKYFVRRLAADGSELSRGEIDVGNEGYLNTWNMQLDSDGNLLVTADTGIRAIKMDGSDAYFIPTDGYVDGLIKFADGRVAVTMYGEQGQTLTVIDTEKKTLGDSIKVNLDTYSCTVGGGDYDIYYNNGMNFYGLDFEKGEPEKIFNWLACDVNPNQLGQLFVDEKGDITAFNSTWNQSDETYDFERVTVTKQPYDSVPRKETIRMAAIYTDYNVLNSIVKFNRTNDKYRIEVDDYSQYNNEENGWDAGVTKLNTEIMAGNMPDILCLGELNYTQLASKGLLEDLYPYIDADKDISRDDFFPNVLGAMEVGGKLYATVPSFYVNAVVGASSIVGDKPGWTYAELNAALDRMPEGCTVFDRYVTKSDMLTNCLALDMDDFVDWSTGKCSFDSQQFVDLLKFANSFPAEFDWDNFDDGESTYDRIAQGKQMLMQVSTYSVEDLMYNDFARYFGGNVTFIGYPTLNGVGNMIGFSESGMAMSAKTPYKDAIWQFMRTFFTEEYQKNGWSLPSNRNVFEEKLKQACTVQYMKDADGNILLDEDGEKIPIVRYSVWDEVEKKNVMVYAVSEEMANTLRELVSTTTKVSNYNSSIFDIVNEQVQAYFEGQRSAEDVAKLIQSKANIYVNEQR